MALKLAAGSDLLKFGTKVGGGLELDILSRSVQKKYGSEVEIVKGNGEVNDVIYSGKENTITETKIIDSITFPTDAASLIGSGTLTNGGIITRISLQASNEDLVRVETEKLEIEIGNSGGN
jgi:hypothetical protein